MKIKRKRIIEIKPNKPGFYSVALYKNKIARAEYRYIFSCIEFDGKNWDYSRYPGCFVFAGYNIGQPNVCKQGGFNK